MDTKTIILVCFMRRHFRRPCVPSHSKPQEEMRKLGGAPQSAPPIFYCTGGIA